MLSVALAAIAGLVIGKIVARGGNAGTTMTFGTVTFAMVAALLSFAAGSALHGDVAARYPLLKLDNGEYVGLVTTGSGVRKTYRYDDAGQKIDARSDVTAVNQVYDAVEPYAIIHTDKLVPPASLFALRIGTKDSEFNQVELHLPKDQFFDRGQGE